MGLAITVFVPEGVVVACDGLAEIHNTAMDQGFLHMKQKRLFVYQNRFLLNVHGDGYIKGLPYAFYVDKIFKAIQTISFATVKSFVDVFSEEIMNYLEKGERFSFYAIGMDKDETGLDEPVVILCDNGSSSYINHGDNEKIVYNFHSFGRSMWLNKLLLPTSFEIDKDNRIDFANVDIDFSKYSLDDAFDFAETLITLSRKMDSLVQLKQMVGDSIFYGVLTMDGQINLMNNAIYHCNRYFKLLH